MGVVDVQKRARYTTLPGTGAVHGSALTGQSSRAVQSSALTGVENAGGTAHAAQGREL